MSLASRVIDASRLLAPQHAGTSRRSKLDPTDDAAYGRIVLGQRRRMIRAVASVAAVVPAVSLVLHLAAGSSTDSLVLAGGASVALGLVAVAADRIVADRLWMPAGALGLVSLAMVLASATIEQREVALFSLGAVALLPIGMAVFSVWGLAGQARLAIAQSVLIAVYTIASPASRSGIDLGIGILGIWLFGTGFGLAGAWIFETARRDVYRAGRSVHTRRQELVQARRQGARTLAQLAAVEAIGVDLARNGPTPDTLDRITDILFEDLGFTHPSIYLGDERLVHLGAQRGYADPILSIAADEGVVGRALTTGKAQFVRESGSDPDFLFATPDIASEITVPLVAGDRIVGVLNVESVDALDATEVASISVVADRIGAALDLAARRRTLESIVESAPLGIVAYDEDATVQFWGAGAEAIFGWTAAEVLGRPSPLVNGIDQERDVAYRAIVAGDRLDGVAADRPTKDGRLIPVRIFAAPLPEGPSRGQVVVYQDLSSERAAADALARSEARYASLVSSLHEGVLLLDASGRVIASNPAAERIFGLSLEEMTAMAPDDPRWATVNEDGTAWDPATSASGVALSTGEPVLGRVFGIAAPGGELNWVAVNAIPVEPGHEPPGGVVVSLTDITERQRLQAELVHAQKMDSVGRLAGGIAHDFNNLLTAILGNSQMLGELVGGEAADHVDQIEHAAERAAELTRQLLGFARKQLLDPGDHELNAIVADMEPMLRRLVGSHVAVVTRLDPHVGHVRVDRSQLDQVLLNLAVNGRDAMPDGGTLVIETLSADRAEVPECLGVDAGRVAILVVRDSGIGMDEEVRSHVFDPFFTTKPRGGGTGLGLATTHGIVAQSGGAITVDSEPGVGSTFSIYLPEVASPAAARPAPVPTDASGDEREPGHGTILLVEDEDAVRDVARRILERAGFRVLHAPNASAAMSLVEGILVDVDLVVSDVVMPGMHGPELVARLRERRPALPAVFLSGFTDLADAADRLPPETHFLSKPYVPEELVRTIRRAIAESPA